MNYEVPGWFYSDRYQHYQKVNDSVYAYVSRMLFGWKAQLYIRGTAAFCECEVRTSDVSIQGLQKMISIADEWLDKYGGNPEKIKTDKYCVYNPKGAWGDVSKKKFWI